MNKRIIEFFILMLMIATTLPSTSTVICNITNEDIPPITDLSGSEGLNPGEVILNWNISLFENPNPGQTFDATYDFRHSDVTIDEGNWDETSSINGDWNPVVAPCVGIELDLYVMAYSDGMVVEWDKARMRAWLTVQFDCFNFYFPGGHGLRGETIYFWVYDPDGNQVFSDTAVTDSHGMAEVITGDLFDTEDQTKPCSEDTFTFKAYWYGHSIGLSNGAVVISTGDREDTKYMYLCDYMSTVPQFGEWGSHGDIYHGALLGATFEFTVPFETVPEYVEVILFSPTSIPPTNGMNPVVPGHMLPFQLEKNIGDPFLNKHIVISVDYPPEMLNLYGGLGESSLRGYRYDELAGQWQLMDDLPIKLNREENRISFETDQLGLFSISAEIDQDGDGLGDLEEETSYYTNPALTDSDNDGISDGDETWFTFSDPNDPKKKEADDQHGLGENLEQGHGYYIAGRIISNDVKSPISNCIYVEIGPIENNIPSVPNINGQINGKIETPYEYTFASTDPDGDNISYFIKWGDGSTTSWTSFLTSGTPYFENHTWSEQNSYIIEAKAKDIYGGESTWATLEVSMPKSKAIDRPLFLHKFFQRFPFMNKILNQIISMN
jgi:hypothetical protein